MRTLGGDAPALRLQLFTGKLIEHYANGFAPCLMDVLTISDAGWLFQQHLSGRMRTLMSRLSAIAEEAGPTR